MTPGDVVRRIHQLGYRFLGRGAYHGIREKLDPRWEYSQLVFTRLVGSFLRPGIRWLDAGCGHRIFETDADREELNMAERVSLTVGCDLDLLALKRHRSIKNRVCCNLSMLPFRDASFDLITLNNVIEHLDEPEVVFNGLARTMNSGGRMVIHTPNSRSYFIRLVRLARLFLPQSLIVTAARLLERRAPEDTFPTHYRANTREHLSLLLRKVGLEEEKVSFARGGHFSASAAPLVILEMLLIRFLDWLGSSELSSAVIIGVYLRLPQADQSLSHDHISSCSVAALGCEKKVAAEVTRPEFKARA